MSACPKCGGANGYFYTLVMAYSMSGSWGREAEVGADKTLSKPQSVRCIDCRKRVDMEVAASDENGIDTGGRVDGKPVRTKRRERAAR